MTRFKIWSFCRFLALLVLIVCPETVQLKPTITHNRTAIMSLWCSLWGNHTEACVKTAGDVLPNKFVQIYESMNEEMKEGIRTGRLESITPENFAKVSTSLFLLIPSYQLKRVSGSALALLLANSQDVAVAVKVMENLNTDMFEDFFTKLQGVELASQIQDVIAKSVVKLLPDVNNWTFPRFRVIEKVGNPLLAHLPSYFLANLTKLEASKFLFHLRNWLWSNLPTYMWYGKTEASKRAWTDLMLRSAYPYNLSEWSHTEVRRFRYFLEGATADELKQLTAQQLQNTKLLRTKLSRLQIRALFSILYSNRDLSSANLTDAQLLPVALQLSPANLVGFSISHTDFRVLTTVFKEGKASYATAKQVLESLIAQSVLLGRLKSVESETWGNGIEHLGKFIYVLPVSALKPYKLSPPTALVQSSIDSERITAKQARLLTGGNILNLEKPDLIMGQKGLLRALSSSQLVSVRTLPQNILYHLLVNLPPGMPVQTAALLHKVKRLLGDSWTLEKILSNTHPNQFFEMLPSRTVAAIMVAIRKVQGFDKVIKGLPRNTLSVLLTAARTNLTNLNSTWTSDNLLSGGPDLALLGLTCNDIYAVETMDFILIMEHYNRLRKAVNKPFPKDLQYCSQLALKKYLEMKASLLGIKHSKQLLDYLEPAEIQAVGGYILATLPSEEVKRATNSQYILEAIGQLSLPELLVATKEIKPYNYAQLLLDKHIHPCQSVTEIKSFELGSFGHLIYFLPAVGIMKINPVSFKLFVESVDDSTSKVVCADLSQRLAWYQIILKAFGEPSTWTSSTLTTLGDLLLALPSDRLNSIPVDSWTEAADTLTEQTSYHMKVEWPGLVDQIQLYQACAELLEDSESSEYIAAVRELARWHLVAVQTQLNTVVKASELLATVYESKEREPERKMVIPNFPMEVQHPDTIVKVLEPDEIEKPFRVKKPGAEMEFGADQDGRTVRVITSDILTGIKVFHSTLKPQTVAPILGSGSTAAVQQSEAVYNIKTSVSPDMTFVESAESSATSLAAKPTESVVSVTPDEEIHASATLLASNVVLHHSAKTWNISIIKELEEMDTSTAAYTTAHTENPVHTSTVVESGSWSDKESHAINNNEDDSYYTIVKVPGETTLPLDTTLKDTTLTERKASTAVVSYIKPIPGDISSAEGKAELSAVFPEKFAEHVENKSFPHERRLDSSAASFQVHEDASLKMDAQMAISSNRSNYENVKAKRHTKTEEQKSNWRMNGSNQAEQSGEILRGVVRTNSLTWQTKPPSESTLSPKIEITSVQPSERKQVFCDAIRAAGQSAGLALDEMDIEHMGHQELQMCVDTLGSLELDDKVQRKIWSLVNKDKLLEHLSDLGHLVKVLDVDDVSKINLSLSSPNALDNLAILSEMVTDTHVLHEVGRHFVKSNPDVKNLMIETTVALGRILCEVLTISSQKLHDLLEESVFLQASPVLGRMKGCPTHCLHKFANFAAKITEYGPPGTWTAEDVASLGVIPAGLRPEQWRELRSTGYGNSPLAGLKPSAVRCIPPRIFKELDSDQLKSLPTMSAAVVSAEQLSYLSESQQSALARVQTVIPILKYSTGKGSSSKENHKPKGSASSKHLNLLVIVALAVISRFST